MAEVPRRTGEREPQSAKELLRKIAEKYGGPDKRDLLEDAGKAAIGPGFSFSDLAIYERYTADQLAALQNELVRRETRPPEQRNTPPASPEQRNTPPASPENRNSGESREKNKTKAAIMGAAALSIAAVATAAGFAGYTFGQRANKEQPAANFENVNEQDANENGSEEMEQAESIDVSDQYAGHFANDNGDGYNEAKSSRYAFGESLENADYETIMKEEEHIAYHEPSLFAAQYYDLDDSAKLVLKLDDGTEINTAGMSMGELDALMDTSESAHRQMASHYLQLIGGEGSGHEMTTLNGKYVNVYGRLNEGSDGQFVSRNIESVHCFKNENGSQAIKFRYKIPGEDGKYAETTLRLGCGLQVVRLENDPVADKIITTTEEVSENPTTETVTENPETTTKTPPETSSETPPETLSEKTLFTEEEMYDDDHAAEEWDNKNTGSGSVGEKPSTASSTEDMGGGGNTGSEPETSSPKSEPVYQEQREAVQSSSSQKSEEVVQQQESEARAQVQENHEDASINAAIDSQPSGSEVKDSFDTNNDGNVDEAELKALLES